MTRKILFAAALALAISGCTPDGDSIAAGPLFGVSQAKAAEVEKPTLTGNPIEDAKYICLVESLDKLNNVKSFGKAESSAVDLYVVAFKLDKQNEALIRYSCGLFELGFVNGILAGRPKETFISTAI